MTIDQAVERKAAHDNLQQELLEELKWTAAALLAIVNSRACAHDLDVINRLDIRDTRTVGQILDADDTVLAKAAGSAA